MELSAPVCTTGVQIMKFHLLNRLVADIIKFGDISALDTFIYKQFNIHIEKAYQESSRRQASRTKKTVRFLY